MAKAIVNVAGLSTPQPGQARANYEAIVDDGIIIFRSSLLVDLASWGTAFEAAMKAQVISQVQSMGGPVLIADDIMVCGTPPNAQVGIGIVKLAADVSNSTTALADITGLSFPVSPNVDYEFDVKVIFRSAATTTGITLAANGPASPVAFVMQRSVPTSLLVVGQSMSRAYNVGPASSGVDTANADMLALLFGLLRNGPNAGSLILRFASEVSGSVITIKAGTVLKWRPI